MSLNYNTRTILTAAFARSSLTHRTSRELTPTQIKAIQAERVDKLAMNLKSMLQRHVQGDPTGFRVSCVSPRECARVLHKWMYA